MPEHGRRDADERSPGSFDFGADDGFDGCRGAGDFVKTGEDEAAGDVFELHAGLNEEVTGRNLCVHKSRA